MHLGSLVIRQWYDSLRDSCAEVPSPAYVETLVRMAALLHDVGHGPFGHFFDDHYLAQFNITHEDLGAHIITHELADLLRRIRRNPHGELLPSEELDPAQVGWLIRRPHEVDDAALPAPDWLRKLRALFSGIYTVDNMDFVLRDSYMSGYNTRAFDLSRLLHYTFFTPQGLTIHARGIPSLINFIEVRANLFRTIYFHRTVRALDLALEDIFTRAMPHLFPGNPLEHLDLYRQFTESSFLVDVIRWAHSDKPEFSAMGREWQAILCRDVLWRMACERTLYFHSGSSEQTTIFSEPELVERRLRKKLPRAIQQIPLKIDVARHYHRPSTRLPAGGQNFVFDPAVHTEPQELTDYELFRSLPCSFSIFRIYARDHQHDNELNRALSALLGDTLDAKTNM